MLNFSEQFENDYCWSLSRDRVSGRLLYRFMIWPRNQEFKQPVISSMEITPDAAIEETLSKLGNTKPC